MILAWANGPNELRKSTQQLIYAHHYRGNDEPALDCQLQVYLQYIPSGF